MDSLQQMAASKAWQYHRIAATVDQQMRFLTSNKGKGRAVE